MRMWINCYSSDTFPRPQAPDAVRAVATNLAQGEPVTAPGLPPGFSQPETLVTADCIRPAIAPPR